MKKLNLCAVGCGSCGCLSSFISLLSFSFLEITMDSYIALVNVFVSQLKNSPDTIVSLFNELYPKTLCNIELRKWKPMEEYNAEDLPVETMTRDEMRAKLADDGWEDEDMVDTLEGVAIDDSYVISAFLDISDPAAPKVVMPCDFAPFAERCRDDNYIWSGVFRWKALEEYAAILEESKMLMITMDCSVMSFPLPTPPAAPAAAKGGKRNPKGRTARRRNRAKKGVQVAKKRPNRRTRRAIKARAHN